MSHSYMNIFNREDTGVTGDREITSIERLERTMFLTFFGIYWHCTACERQYGFFVSGSCWAGEKAVLKESVAQLQLTQVQNNTLTLKHHCFHF